MCERQCYSVISRYSQCYINVNHHFTFLRIFSAPDIYFYPIHCTLIYCSLLYWHYFYLNKYLIYRHVTLSYKPFQFSIPNLNFCIIYPASFPIISAEQRDGKRCSRFCFRVFEPIDFCKTNWKTESTTVGITKGEYEFCVNIKLSTGELNVSNGQNLLCRN